MNKVKIELTDEQELDLLLSQIKSLAIERGLKAGDIDNYFTFGIVAAETLSKCPAQYNDRRESRTTQLTRR